MFFRFPLAHVGAHFRPQHLGGLHAHAVDLRQIYPGI
jgi:hypothetical protein